MNIRQKRGKENSSEQQGKQKTQQHEEKLSQILKQKETKNKKENMMKGEIPSLYIRHPTWGQTAMKDK